MIFDTIPASCVITDTAALKQVLDTCLDLGITTLDLADVSQSRDRSWWLMMAYYWSIDRSWPCIHVCMYVCMYVYIYLQVYGYYEDGHGKANDMLGKVFTENVSLIIIVLSHHLYTHKEAKPQSFPPPLLLVYHPPTPLPHIHTAWISWELRASCQIWRTSDRQAPCGLEPRVDRGVDWSIPDLVQHELCRRMYAT